MTTLQFLRLEQRLGQHQLARLAGVPQPTVSMIETGRVRPTEAELERLARALDVPPNVLMREVVADLSPEGLRP